MTVQGAVSRRHEASVPSWSGRCSRVTRESVRCLGNALAEKRPAVHGGVGLVPAPLWLVGAGVPGLALSLALSLWRQASRFYGAINTGRPYRALFTEVPGRGYLGMSNPGSCITL